MPRARADTPTVAAAPVTAGPGRPRRERGRPSATAAPVAPDDELLTLALETFAERGYEGASVRDLCRRLGVSHNLVHQRYGGKDRLWYAAVDHGFGTLAAGLAAAVSPELPDDLARLRAVLVRFVEITAASPALLQVINQEATRPGPRLDHIFDHYISPAADLVAHLLGQLERDGAVREVPRGVFHFLVANGAAGPMALTALADRFGDTAQRRSPEAVRAYAESVIDLLLAGMTSPQRRTATT